MPWQSLDKAKVFEDRMSMPWLAEVSLDEESGEYLATLEDVGGMFWEQSCLVGNDRLVDLLAERAEEVRSAFDIRDLVKESLRLPLKEQELQPELPSNLKAVNVVRQALGQEPLCRDRELTPFQSLSLRLKERVSRAGAQISSYHLQVLSPDAPPMLRMILGAPEGFDEVALYTVSFQLANDYEQEIDFRELPEVKKASYSRPGLLKVYFVP